MKNSSNVNNSTLVTVSTNSRSPNARIPCPGCGVGGGSTYVSGDVSFNQKDMPVPDILLFYVEVFLMRPRSLLALLDIVLHW